MSVVYIRQIAGMFVVYILQTSKETNLSQKNFLHHRKIKSQIFDLLKCHESNIYSPSEIREIVDNCKAEWDLPKSVTFPQFCTFLRNEFSLTPEKCVFSRTYTRYTIEEVPLYDFLLIFYSASRKVCLFQDVMMA
jgi:hypothetical protein